MVAGVVRRFMDQSRGISSERLSGSECADLHRTVFITRLSAVGVENRGGELVDAAVVHRKEDLTSLDGRRDPRSGGQRAAA